MINFLVLHTFISSCSTHLFTISHHQTSPITSHIHFTHPSPLYIFLPIHFFPYIPKKATYILLKTNQTQLLVISGIKKLKYDKLVARTCNYGHFDERGFDVCIVSKKYGVYKFRDSCLIPDFTVPFLAINTCGCGLVLILSIVVKKYIENSKNKRV